MSAAIALATHVDQDLHGSEIFDINKERAALPYRRKHLRPARGNTLALDHQSNYDWQIKLASQMNDTSPVIYGLEFQM